MFLLVKCILFHSAGVVLSPLFLLIFSTRYTKEKQYHLALLCMGVS